MIGLAFALIVLGYAFQYTGVMNLLNGGNGPGLFKSLGVDKTLSSPGSQSNTDSGGNSGSGPGGILGGIIGGIGPISNSPLGGNQTGQPPSSNSSPTVLV